MALNNFGLGFQVFAEDVASKVFEKVRGELGRTEKAAGGVNVTLGDLKGEFSSMGARFLGLSSTIFSGFADATMSAAAFNKGITELGTLVDKTKFSTAEMTDIVKQMMQQYGGDSRTQIAAMYQGISAGAGDATAAMGLLHAANQLAIAGNTDQATAITGLTKIMNNYKIAFTDSAKVSDAFLTAVQGGLTTVGELGHSVGEVAASAFSAGISMEELIGALGTAATLTRDTAGATAGLKAVLSGVAHPTSEAAAEAQRLGIKFDSATLRAKGLQGFLESITKSTKYNADSMAKLFGSQEAVNVMTALATDNMAAFNGMMDSMAKKTGKGQRAFEEMNMTMAQQMSVLSANIEILKVDLGNALAPITGFLVGIVKKIITGFNQLGPTFKKVVTYAGLVVGALAGLLGGLLTGAAAVAGLVIAGKALLIGLAAVAGAFQLVVAMMAPLILVGTTLYFMWTRDIGGLATRVTAWFDKIKLAFKALGQVFSDGAFSGDVQAELSKAENSGIKAFAIQVFLWFNRIKNFFSSLGDAFSTGLSRVGPVVEKILGAISKLASHFGIAQDSAGEAKDQFEAWGATGAKIGDFLATVIEKLATGFLYVVSFVEGAVDSVAMFKPVFSALWEAVKQVFNVVKELFGQFSSGNSSLTTTADTFTTLGNILGGVITVGLTLVTAQIRILAGAISIVSGVVGGLMTLFSGVIQVFSLGIDFVVALLSGEWGKAWDLAKQMVLTWANTLIQVLAKVVGGVAGAVDSIAGIFGKDLGLKKGVEGISKDINNSLVGGPATPALPPPPANTPTAAAAPGVAAAGAQAQQSAAIAAAAAKPGGGPPVDVTVKSQIVLDGAVVGEAVQKANAQSAGRGFTPQPSPP